MATLQANDATDGWRYTYDYRNRLIKIESTDDITDDPVDWEEDPVALYYYDGLNRRIKKDLTNGNDVVYLYDGWRCVEEREVDGGTWEMRRQYVYGGQYIDEPVLFDKDTDDDEEIDVSYWYLHDTNYNIVALADATGGTLERCWYEPYGPTTFTNASGIANTPPSESDYANTLAFQGQRLDTDSGLYYFRNRHYSPTLGRFVQTDPGSAMSMYRFIDPVNHVDPLGLEERYSIINWELEGTLNEVYGKLIAQHATEAGASHYAIRPDSEYLILYTSRIQLAGCPEDCGYQSLVLNYIVWHVKGTMRLPVWKDAQKRTEEDRFRFEAFARQVEAHERAHLSIAEAHANLYPGWSELTFGTGCSEAEAQTKAIVEGTDRLLEWLTVKGPFRPERARMVEEARAKMIKEELALDEKEGAINPLWYLKSATIEEIKRNPRGGLAPRTIPYQDE